MTSWYLREFHCKNSLLDLFAKLYLHEYSFFLYSSIFQNENSRFSYMSCDPSIVFTAKHNKIIINKKEKIEKYEGNPFQHFVSLMTAQKIDYKFNTHIAGMPFFKGGAIGYWGYDMKNHIEQLSSTAEDNPNLPDSCWMFYDGHIVIDHLKNKYYFVGTDEGIQRLEKVVNNNDNIQPKKEAVEYNITHTVTKADYMKQIGVVKEHIADGDVYELNLAQRFNVIFRKKEEWTEFRIFKNLIDVSPSPFSAFLKCGNVSVISSSPERFLRIHDREAESKPIKGTRPRHSDFFKDEAMYFELLHSEKDRAENVMIVDLVRNDLGRVSETGSVQVTRLFDIEKYSTVFQMVSTINSKLKENCTNIDVVKACFPPGSMTGAPKIRAMEIIDELELFNRGVYSGALGYIGYDGTMDLSVVIRTLILQGEKGYFQTGGAIVWDSEADEEYQECIDKAQGIIKALERLNRD
ncbi:aminodeoxychorismate synthase component I [bacterium]|nr:MAG: aminodeoxychorismate synthase component I [bacterium]